MKMKWILLKMEYKWRAFRILRKLLNRMISKGMRYNSFCVCFINRKLNNYLADLIELKKYYENVNDIKIDYYKKYEI